MPRRSAGRVRGGQDHHHHALRVAARNMERRALARQAQAVGAAIAAAIDLGEVDPLTGERIAGRWALSAAARSRPTLSMDSGG